MNEPPIEPPITCVAVTSPSPPNRITKPATTAAIPTGQSTADSNEVRFTCRCSHPCGSATSQRGPRGSPRRASSQHGKPGDDHSDVLADGGFGDQRPLAD